MVYIFDPPLGKSPGGFGPGGPCDEFNPCYRANKPIPAAYFPPEFIVDEPVRDVPEIFRANTRIIMFSERARALMEKLAPGQVEFLPVNLQIAPDVARQSSLASAYYYINVPGRAQRFQWLEMPTRPFQTGEDGIECLVATDEYPQWKLRQRAPNEPLIWREDWWRFGNKQYRGHFEILIEETLWQALAAEFPNQLNPIEIGTSVCPVWPSS